MKLLLDENLSPLVAEILAVAGHDAVHVRELGLAGASDAQVLATAALSGRTLVSGDTDFGDLLARLGWTTPSVVILRHPTVRRAQDVASLVDTVLSTEREAIDGGAVVVATETRLRSRRLPIKRGMT